MIRRDFIRSSGAVMAGSLLAPVPLFAAEDKIKLAMLGTGWWGTDLLLANVLNTGAFDVVALCDIDSLALDHAADVVLKATGKKPKTFADYKEMYAMPGLQAVAIATPTHWHALQFIDACNRGLHVFLEKPVSYDIREGQAMLEAHRKANNVVQVDFPRTTLRMNDEVKAYIQSGEAGKILQVQVNINNPEGALVEKEIPGTFDFETFCGPAPKQKFLCGPGTAKPVWRGQHAFSRGVMADWGIHYLHNAREVLGLGLPGSVTAIGGTVKNFSTDNPDHLEVLFDFDGLPVYWSHKAWGFTSPVPETNIGVFYYGEKATVFEGDLGWAIYAGDVRQNKGEIGFGRGADAEAVYNKMISDLFMEFAVGVRKKSNEGITNTLDKAQKSTSCVIYGDMAFRTGSRLVIDRASMNITNNKEAQAMLRREYRAPYKHPYPA